MDEKTKAKLWLYHQILAVPSGKLTSIEIEIGYLLAQDHDVQAYLDEKLKEKKI